MTLLEPQATDRLLLVDDNPTNLQVLFQALEDEGYELLVAQSGTEAIATAKEAKPQLILLDINMPGIDGYETCRQFKADPATSAPPVIFLSARMDVEDKVKGLETGAVDYISKPFQFEEVVARVRKHLETFHRQRELVAEKKALESQLSGGFREFTEPDLAGLIEEGESDRFELKSTLRQNLHTGKPDKRIENAVLKTLAAFLNSSGGVLLVGVDDDGNPLGLAADNFPNEDKFLLHLNTLIRNHIGVEFARLVRSRVRDLGGKRVLAVECLRSDHPVFFRRDNDEAFYIRSGPGTQALTPSDLLAYLENR